jgi:hypothetical protein
MRRKRSYGITLREAQKHLDAWLEAELEITTHQSYKLGEQQLTMADLGDVRKNIEYWDGKVKQLSREQAAGGRNRAYHAVPRDY